MSNRTRVVVTGLGATTPLGGDVPTTWAALLAGKSGARLLNEEWTEVSTVKFAARVAVDPSEVMERVEMRRLDRSEQFAMIAAREAWADAGTPDVDKERLGVVIASGIGGVSPCSINMTSCAKRVHARLARTPSQCSCQMDLLQTSDWNCRQRPEFILQLVLVHLALKQSDMRWR